MRDDPLMLRRQTASWIRPAGGRSKSQTVEPSQLASADSFPFLHHCPPAARQTTTVEYLAVDFWLTGSHPLVHLVASWLPPKISEDYG